MVLAVIRVFTSKDPAVLTSHEEIIRHLYGITVRTYCIPEQPYGIHDAATEKVAVPKIAAAATQAEADGAEAIFISCAADPGVEAARAILHIPVLGAGTCAAAVAMTLGRKIGVLNLTGNTPASPAALLGERLEMELAPKGVENTADLLTTQGEEAAVHALKRLAAKCDVVMLACTGFATIRFAEKMRPKVQIPIVDAVEAGGAMAQMILRKMK